MDVEPSRGLLRYFDHVPDPRAANVSFSLSSLLAMTLLAVLCRCDDYDEIACWCSERADWLATFLELPEGKQGPRTRGLAAAAHGPWRSSRDRWREAASFEHEPHARAP